MENQFAFKISYPCIHCKKTTKHVFFDFKKLNLNLNIDDSSISGYCLNCNLLTNVKLSTIEENITKEAIGGVDAQILVGRWSKLAEAQKNNESNAPLNPQTAKTMSKYIILFAFLFGIIGFFILFGKTNVFFAFIGGWVVFALSLLCLSIFVAASVKVHSIIKKGV